MNIFDTLEKYLSSVDRKYDVIKIRTSSVKSSSTLFSCLIRGMYNVVNRAQKQCLQGLIN